MTKKLSRGRPKKKFPKKKLHISVNMRLWDIAKTTGNMSRFFEMAGSYYVSHAKEYNRVKGRKAISRIFDENYETLKVKK